MLPDSLPLERVWARDYAASASGRVRCTCNESTKVQNPRRNSIHRALSHIEQQVPRTFQANLFASKFANVLNSNSSSSRDSLHSSLQSSIESWHLRDVHFSDEEVLEALSLLKSKKTDSDGVSSDHLKLASSAIAKPLAIFLTSVVRHGYLPQCLSDCVLIPIPKGSKDPSCSLNYRAVALASSVSKVLEHLIIKKYSSYFCTSSLQFGFKPGYSTTLCTGVVKNVVSRYIHRGSSVLGCFLDASKAFDLVDHGMLFDKLLTRGLPVSIVRFLSSWYYAQKMCARWNSSFSDSFHVSNGVRQGGVLSPMLFAVYVDSLLEMLEASGVGCYSGGCFVGAVCYADDIVLLAPCASALRVMLNICDTFASSHGLVFNAAKTQLICFRQRYTHTFLPELIFNGSKLKFVEEVTHLGHILANNLDDKRDIIRAVKDLNRKANSVLCKFSSLDPFVKCFLIKSYCLSLYGSPLWSLSSPSLRIIEVALNKLLRKVWNLPYNSHRSIVHCTSHIPTVSHLVFNRFCSLMSSVSSSSSALLHSVFIPCTQYIFTFTGYNYTLGHEHCATYSTFDFHAANLIRHIRSSYGLKSPCEGIIFYVSCY